MNINKTDIINVLSENKFISEFDIEATGEYNNIKYEFVVYCSFVISEQIIPVKICIPNDWRLSLFDIYLEEPMFIPHIDKDGKLCLYDLEGTIINPNFTGVFNQCLNKAYKIIHDGINRINEGDFIDEFDSYFSALDKCESVAAIFPADKKCQSIWVCKNNSNSNSATEKNTKWQYFVSTSTNDFDTWGYKGTSVKGLFLFIKPSETIYPPNFCKQNTQDYLNMLLSYLDVAKIKKLLKKIKSIIFMFFEIQQLNGIINQCGFLIKNGKFTIENKVLIESCNSIYPLTVCRYDKNFLLTRTKFGIENNYNKSVLLIGCGSIGGYIFHNLIKAGFTELMLVDNDFLHADNIYRHLLGKEYVGFPKCVALASHAYGSIPNVNVSYIIKKMQNAIYDKDLICSDYDYIISAVGDHSFNLWLNDYAKENNLKMPLFYIWNEPLDIGCHVARIKIDNPGDYRNMFKWDTSEIEDMSSYTEKSQNFRKAHLGCNGSYIEYGSNMSMESSLLFMDLFRKELYGNIFNNIISSKKGTDRYFVREGYKTSNRYKKQRNIIQETKIVDLLKADD